MSEYTSQINFNCLKGRKYFSQGSEWFTEEDSQPTIKPSGFMSSSQERSLYPDKRTQGAFTLTLGHENVARIKVKRYSAFDNINPVVDTAHNHDIQEEFSRLVAQWREETKLSSSSTEIFMNPSYQRIIGLGPKVIPFVLNDLKVNGGHWFWALMSLTGENPVGPEDAGRIKKMTTAWLNWGKAKGLIS